jgi:tRNA threonylcarbamoyl adenosine modification protein YeaZ
MAHLLAFDTSTDVGSVAIFKNGVLHAEELIRSPMNLLIWLSPTIQKILKETNLPVEQVHALAVGIGPGSFTGVRLQLATARAFAQARGIPLYGISGLETLAFQVLPWNGMILSCIDARRGELFYGFFEGRGSSLSLKEELGCLSPDKIVIKAQRYKGSWIVVGENNPFRDALAAGLPEALFADSSGIIKASTIGILAYQKKNILSGDLFAVDPLYLRGSNAEIERKRS